jgi:hypothetical protein
MWIIVAKFYKEVAGRTGLQIKRRLKVLLRTKINKSSKGNSILNRPWRPIEL